MKVVAVTDLEKSYRFVHALNGVSFSVDAGEIFGLLDPGEEGPELRKRIGMQLQESALPKDIKVREAMDLYASFYENPIDWEPLLDRIGLSEKRESRFSKLSGGQEQRLYIALALVNDPEVVFFDEITTGLDPQSRRVMWNLIQEIRDQGKTVFLTTHFMDEAQVLCDKLVILGEGRIIATGTTDELIRGLGLDNRMVSTFSLGFIITSLAPTVRTAETAGMAIYFPMIFLSGATIPIQTFPDGLRKGAQLLPMTHIVALLQGVWFGGKIPDHPVNIAVIAGLAVVGVIVSAATFKWE